MSKPLGSVHLAVTNLRQEQEESAVVTLWGGESSSLSSRCRFGFFFSFVLLLKIQFRARGKSQAGTVAVASLGTHF